MAEGHTARAHARLSPSGAARWLNCTAAPSMEDGQGDTSSEAAEEGTLAHELAEISVERYEKRLTSAEYRKEHSRLKKHPLYRLEMNDYVAVYRDYIKHAAMKLRKHAPTEVLTEMKLDLSAYVPEGSGLCDNIIACENGTIEIIDFKYGRVFVEVENNPQLMLYGLGALEYYSMIQEVNTVIITIVQPRADNIASQTFTAAELREWGESIKSKALEAHENRGALVSGDWCKYCKAKAVCTEHAKALQSFVEIDETSDPRKLGKAEQTALYMKIKQAETHIKALKEHIFKASLKGEKYQGLKLVKASTRRVIAEPAKVINILTEKKYEATDFMAVKLKSISELEKLLTKKVFDREIGAAELGYIRKPDGGPTLALATDKRPEWKESSAADDFGVEENDLL